MNSDSAGEATRFRRLDPICDDFERALQTGSRPRLEDFLRAREGDEKSWLLRELLGLELDYHLREGRQPNEDEYRKRFPEHSTVVQDAFANATVLAESPRIAAPVKRRSLELPPVIHGYELLEELGRGGMGVVYKARDQQLKRHVAFKLIHASARPRDDVIARARTEAEAVARLQHPNVVQIFRIGEFEGHPYLVLEYVAGGNLAQQLMDGPLLPRKAAALARTLAHTMQMAHGKNIVHRDLKPANVLLGVRDEGLGVSEEKTTDHASNETKKRDQKVSSPYPLTPTPYPLNPKITDFGLAKLLDEQGTTRSGVIIGTPSYMAPEQIDQDAGDIGPRSDIYAIGAILYEMLTGRPPFHGATVLDTVEQVRRSEPVAIRRLQPKTPRDLETICLKCLRKEPAKRYADAKSLTDDLTRFLDGKPIQARPIGAFERSWKWVKRRPLNTAALVLLLLAIVAGVGGSWWYVNKQAATRETVKAALDEADVFMKDRRWPESLAAVERAREVLRSGFGTVAQQRFVERQFAELTLANSLEHARRNDIAVDPDTNQFDYGPVFSTWRQALEEYGVAVPATPPEETVQRLGGCRPAVREQLVETLDLWITWANRDKHADDIAWLHKVVQKLDTDNKWRQDLRLALVKNDKAALHRLAERVKITEQSPTHLMVNSFGLLAVGDPGAAIKLLRRAQREYPDHFSINYVLSSLTAKLRPPDYGSAIVYMTAAAAIQPDHAGVHQSLGYFHFRQGKFDDCIAACKKAIRHRPNYAAPYLYMGRALLAKEDVSGAIKALEKAAALQPAIMQAYFYLGHAYEKQSKWEKASGSYLEAVAIRPELPEIHLPLGLCLWKIGKLSQALMHLEKGHALGSKRENWNHPTAQQVALLKKLVNLEPNLDDVLNGKTKPNPRDSLHYAELCRHKHRYLDAAKLYRSAFTWQPALGIQQLGSRSQAAGAALLAARDATTDADRTEWRKQALAWLRADMADLPGLLKTKQISVRSINRFISIWRTDKDYRNVRENHFLNEVPETERDAWRQFWVDVDTLEKKYSK